MLLAATLLARTDLDFGFDDVAAVVVVDDDDAKDLLENLSSCSTERACALKPKASYTDPRRSLSRRDLGLMPAG